MPTVNVNLGQFACEAGVFYPERNAAVFHGDWSAFSARELKRKPIAYGAGVLSGSILMGLRDKRGHKRKLKDVIAFVRDTRVEQAGDPGASFISQHGLFKHKTGKVIEEESVRIAILNLSDETPEQFEQHILELAEGLSDAFGQEETIVSFDRGGVTQSVYGVTGG